ncbi:MAG: hypothetical protein ACRDRO_04480 [Pseudonocardiaceae bacterium]
MVETKGQSAAVAAPARGTATSRVTAGRPRIEDYVPHLAEFGTTTDCHRALRLGTVRGRRIGTAADEAFLASGVSWAHLS